MGGIYTFENDTGPDEANHDWHGIFVLSTAARLHRSRARCPTSPSTTFPNPTRLMDQPIPDGLVGARSAEDW